MAFCFSLLHAAQFPWTHLYRDYLHYGPMNVCFSLNLSMPETRGSRNANLHYLATLNVKHVNQVRGGQRWAERNFVKLCAFHRFSSPTHTANPRLYESSHADYFLYGNSSEAGMESDFDSAWL